MCNAHNHPPGCNCGWGGVWYGGHGDSASWLFDRKPPPRRLGLQSGTSGLLSAGYVNPNSKCPVCGAAVYYYESPYGGRVFFDSLGPPWPRHPCTSADRGSETTFPVSRPAWHHDNWEPLSNVTISMSPAGASTYSISGERSRRAYQFFFRASEIVMAEIVRFRKEASGAFHLSILDFDATRNEWAVWDGPAFTEINKLLSDNAMLKRTIIHSHTSLKPDGAPTGRPSLTPEFITCPYCKANVKASNLPRHLRKVHQGVKS
jgi:hypothetical protein